MNLKQTIVQHRVYLALSLTGALLMTACGATAIESPAATTGSEQASVVQQSAEDVASDLEGEEHQEEAEEHEDDDEHHDEEGEHHDEEGEHHDEEDEGEHREHGPHEHGAATLTVAWSGNEMAIELDTPAFNLFGFEYEPATAEEIQLVEDSLSALESGELMILNEEAGCRLSSANTVTAWSDESDHDEDADADHEHDEETHSDVLAQFALLCDSPEAIRSMDLGPLFERFPNFEDLDAQWVSDTTQSAAELTAASSLLTFR